MSRLCLLPKGTGQHLIVQLPDPRTGEPSCYAFQGDHLLEVQRVDTENAKSWFVGNTVQQDGSLYVLSPFDPLFLLIPVLDRSRRKTSENLGVYRPLDDLEGLASFPQLTRLLELTSSSQCLAAICDVQDCGRGIRAFRLNDLKTVLILKGKVDRIYNQFEEVRMLKPMLARFSIASLEDAEMKNLIKKRIAVRVVCEYLSEEWSNLLQKEYDFVKIENLEKRSAEGYMNNEPIDYGRRRGGDADDEPSTKKKRMSNGQQKLAKANIKGMKTMQSFFVKKGKENVAG